MNPKISLSFITSLHLIYFSQYAASCTSENASSQCVSQNECKEGRECREGVCVDSNTPKKYTCESGIQMMRDTCSPPLENCQTKSCQDQVEKEYQDILIKCQKSTNETGIQDYFNCKYKVCTDFEKYKTIDCEKYLP